MPRVESTITDCKVQCYDGASNMVGTKTGVATRIRAILKKSATFRFGKSAKNVKNNGPKTEKTIFSLLNLSKNYRTMLDCSTR